MTNADLLRAAILAEMEWNFERTPARRRAADEAQARVLERMRAQDEALSRFIRAAPVP